MQEIRDAGLLDYAIFINLFDELKPNELLLIGEYLHLMSFEAGEVLFREGDAGDFACFVVEGALEVTKSRDGYEVVIAQVASGKALGEMSLFDHFNRSATVTALSYGKLLLLQSREFARLNVEHPHIGNKILGRMARLMSLNLRETSEELADMLQLTERPGPDHAS